MAAAPPVLDQLIARFDASAFDAPAGRARLPRLSVDDGDDWDFVVSRSSRRLEPADRNTRADARLCADRATWARVARDLRGGMNAFRGGRLQIRDNLHLGVGFLAATSGAPTSPGGCEFAPRAHPAWATRGRARRRPRSAAARDAARTRRRRRRVPADGGPLPDPYRAHRRGPAGLRRLRQARTAPPTTPRSSPAASRPLLDAVGLSART